MALANFVENIKKAYPNETVKIFLYGSRARGDADLLSDIDVLIVVKKARQIPAVDKSCAIIANEVSLNYDVVISVIVVNERQYNESFEPLLINIRREGKKVA